MNIFGKKITIKSKNDENKNTGDREESNEQPSEKNVLLGAAEKLTTTLKDEKIRKTETGANKEASEKEEKKSVLTDTVNFLTGKEDEKTNEKKEKDVLPGFWEYARKVWKEPQSNETPQGTVNKALGIWKNYQDAKSHESSSRNVYEKISEAAALNTEFIVLLIGSVLVATFGLLQGSTAVIIGAMIIAPLMMPILGFALGSIWGDLKLISRSAITLFMGIIFAVLLSALISYIVPGSDYNAEILARTGPNLFDVLIALASGFVGAYAYANPMISSSISGVAIAVALMPPLCTIGITLGNQDFSLSLGATILFLINMVGIALAASLVFWRQKIHPVTDSKQTVKARAMKQILVASVVLIGLTVPVTIFTIDSFANKRDRNEAVAYINTNLPQAETTCDLTQNSSDAQTFKCTLVIPSYISKEQIEKIETQTQKFFHKKTDVVFTTLAVFNFSDDIESKIDQIIKDNIQGEVLKYELNRKEKESSLSLIVLAQKYPKQKTFDKTQNNLQELLGKDAKITLKILRGIEYENEEEKNAKDTENIEEK